MPAPLNTKVLLTPGRLKKYAGAPALNVNPLRVVRAVIVRFVTADGPRNAVPVLVMLPGTTFGVQLVAVLKFPNAEGGTASQVASCA